MTIEQSILTNLIKNEVYSRQVLPFLKEEYFFNKIEKTVFSTIYSFINKYNSLPTEEAISIEVESMKTLTEGEVRDATELISSIFAEEVESNNEWLLECTETFCKDKAVYNAIMESIHIIDGKSKNEYTENAIPEILSDALSVSFDTHIGHDYIEDAEERFKFYHKVETKVPFDLTFMNTITNGGTPQKTLNIVMAGTGVGKSLFMCHHSASCLSQGLNVLYITCEMAEEKIAERIDANLMDITMDDLKSLPEMSYAKKIQKIQKNNCGKLIVKEYPTATANSNHFRYLLDELKLKKKFKPDIIFVDYLNICASSRMKMNASVNSYTYIKAIAEELRGLAVEYNVPVWSATQVNRSGFTSSDFGMEDTSESFGLPATADFMIALIGTEELDSLNQILVKQLKNRYNDGMSNRKFLVGINRAKMKLFDLEDAAQNGLVASGQPQTSNISFDSTFKKNTDKNKFNNWKV
ncbi:TPA: AAA family ATPase [Candidatus Woesearchaeota archaeon]|jgi:replicative DNA helicase|nr:AAA family ATPase [Candidatus Woesearchaeota archaeon]